MPAGVLLVAGKLVVDEVLVCDLPPELGSNQRARERRLAGGGQVWHATRAAASVGARVAVTGWCGSDADSTHLRAVLAATPALDRLVVHDPAPHSTVLVYGDDRIIVSYGSTGYLAPEAVPADALDGVRLLHVDGFALDAVSGDALVALASCAHARGVAVTLEPPRVGKIESSAPWLAVLPPLFAVLGRPDEIEGVRDTLVAPPVVTVAHDQHRPVVTCSGRVREVTPVPAAAVDALGAGDRFAGGWLAANLNGASLAEAAVHGIRAAQG